MFTGPLLAGAHQGKPRKEKGMAVPGHSNSFPAYQTSKFWLQIWRLFVSQLRLLRLRHTEPEIAAEAGVDPSLGGSLVLYKQGRQLGKVSLKDMNESDSAVGPEMTFSVFVGWPIFSL